MRVYVVFQNGCEDPVSYHLTQESADKMVDEIFSRNRQEHVDFDTRLLCRSEIWVDSFELRE